MRYGWVFPILLWASAWAQAADWDYSRTHFVGAGLTEWADPKVSTFDKYSRQDTLLAGAFVLLGVPHRQVKLLIDKEATRARMLRALRATLEKSREGDSLVFYFAGHGVEDKATGKVHFMPYDAKTEDPRFESYWSAEA